jgi:hypothetical protein
MIFAPEGTNLVERRFVPRPPTADNYDVWPDAARRAIDYWRRLADSNELSSGFRPLCSSARHAVEAIT